MFSSAARTIVSRAAASAASRGAVANRLNVQPSMMAVRFGSVSFYFFLICWGDGMLMYSFAALFVLNVLDGIRISID